MTTRCARRPRLRVALTGGVAWGVAAALVLAGFVAPASAQKRGGTLTIVRPTDPVSLDPHLETTAPGAWVYYDILESLLALDEKLQIQPTLAHAWEILSVKGFAMHPVEYNLGLWKTWLDR